MDISAHLETIRVALLGDTTTRMLVPALKVAARLKGFDLQIQEAEYNQIERQVFDSGSELYTYDAEVIILFHSTQKLLQHYNKMDTRENLAEERLQLITRLCTTIGARTNARIIYYNYPEIDDAIYGQYANKIGNSFLFQLRKLNYLLMEYAAGQPNLHLFDLSTIQNQLGKPQLFHPALYINADIVLHPGAYKQIADGTVSLIGALFRRIHKCVIVDLDNTLWGGTIGDDGVENLELGYLGVGKAFTEFQYWLKKLKDRGIILAVCSKNSESVVMPAFESHPDMILTKDDIAVFQINWENKVDNIRRIQATLNIGFDSMVFLDDNPFERNMVRDGIPEITVPELPEDPAEFLEYLYTQNLFETTSVSAEDKERTKFYQLEARRKEDVQHYANEEAFLESLNMLSTVKAFDQFNMPRVAQLIQRSNQFNLRSVFYTGAQIRQMADHPGTFTFSFGLKDRYSDNGIICVVVLKKESDTVLFIDTWLMSCRVLKRGMEDFTLNTLVDLAKKQGIRYLKGEYLATSKNEMVKDHYERLGFESKDGYWLLDVQGYTNRKTYINYNDGQG